MLGFGVVIDTLLTVRSIGSPVLAAQAADWAAGLLPIRTGGSTSIAICLPASATRGVRG